MACNMYDDSDYYCQCCDQNMGRAIFNNAPYIHKITDVKSHKILEQSIIACQFQALAAFDGHLQYWADQCYQGEHFVLDNMGNIIAHEYSGINLWSTYPKIKTDIERHLQQD